jgi:hypothetical protein
MAKRGNGERNGDDDKKGDDDRTREVKSTIVAPWNTGAIHGSSSCTSGTVAECRSGGDLEGSASFGSPSSMRILMASPRW